MSKRNNLKAVNLSQAMTYFENSSPMLPLHLPAELTYLK